VAYFVKALLCALCHPICTVAYWKFEPGVEKLRWR